MTSLMSIFCFMTFNSIKKNIALYFSAISLYFFLEITYAKHTSASTSMAFITIPLMASNEFFQLFSIQITCTGRSLFELPEHSPPRVMKHQEVFQGPPVPALRGMTYVEQLERPSSKLEATDPSLFADLSMENINDGPAETLNLSIRLEMWWCSEGLLNVYQRPYCCKGTRNILSHIFFAPQLVTGGSC